MPNKRAGRTPSLDLHPRHRCKTEARNGKEDPGTPRFIAALREPMPFVDKRNEGSLFGPASRRSSVRSDRHRNRQMTWSPVDGITGSSSVEEKSKPSVVGSHQRNLVELVL